jgi:vesicle coat complex subunit
MDSANAVGNVSTSDLQRGKVVPQNAREGALLLIRALCELGMNSLEPFVVPLLAAAVDECGSSSSGVREAAEDAAVSIVSLANPMAMPLLVLPVLFEALHSPEWRVKACALERLCQVAGRAPSQTSQLLPKIIPTVTSQIWDTKPQVRQSFIISASSLSRLFR